MRPASVVYWLRFSLAILVGFASHYLKISEARFGEFALYAGIGLAVIFYAISVGLVRYLFRYGEAELKGKNRYITLGGGTFIVVWIMVAVVLNTIGK